MSLKEQVERIEDAISERLSIEPDERIYPFGELRDVKVYQEDGALMLRVPGEQAAETIADLLEDALAI